MSEMDSLLEQQRRKEEEMLFVAEMMKSERSDPDMLYQELPKKQKLDH